MQINIADGVDIDAQRIMTGRCCVIGQSGSGKSFLIGVLAEELAKAKLPFLIIDTEGEYVNLGKAYGLIVVGSGIEANVGFDTDYTLLFRQSIQAKKPVIIDVSDVIDQKHEVFSALKALYSVEEELRSPYLIIIEEADKFVPQIVKSSINMVEEISIRGRKRGIGLLVATQRPANISKNVLAQCSYGFIGRLTIENDFDSISILLENRKRMEEVARLSTGEFLPFGLGIEQIFKVKPRGIVHSGSTPLLDYSNNSEISLDEVLKNMKSGDISHKERQYVKQKTGIQPKDTNKISVISGINGPEELMQRLQGTKGSLLRLLNLKNYSIEELKTVYAPFVEVTIMVPMGKGSEYYEINAIYDNSMREVNIGKEMKLVSHAPTKKPRLNEKEIAALEVVRRENHSKTEKVAKECGIGIGETEKMLIRLERLGLLEFDGKNYKPKAIKRRKAYALKTIEIAPEGDYTLLEFDERNINGIVVSNYPGCKVESYYVFYMPFYRVKLRSKNRVKVALFNPISLKEEKASRLFKLNAE